MGKNQRIPESSPEAVLDTNEIESLILTALDGEEEHSSRQEAVDALWIKIDLQTGEGQTLAIWGLCEVAKDGTGDSIGGYALDRLDRIAKEAPPGSETQRFAAEGIRVALEQNHN